MAKIYRGFLVRYSGLLLIVAVVPLISSCDNGGTTPGSDDGTGYPHNNGSEWVYTYEGEDFVKYNISGTYNHPAAGNTQVLITYVATKGIYATDWAKYDEDYLTVSDTEVRVYPDDEDPGYFLLLKFPLKVDSKWTFYGNTDATVTKKETISVPAGSFETYKIDYHGDFGFTMWYSTTIGGWGVKNYGWWFYGDDPVTIELSSYNLPS